MIAPFHPFESLAADLLPHATDHDDGAHDLAHLERVWKNARAIQREEGGDSEIVAAAVLLHDCVSVEKDSPQRGQASRLSAEKASEILSSRRWAAKRIEEVAHAIAAHSFSGGITPHTLEAKILQDADRLDSIGLVGVARCFYTAGRMGSALYDCFDPQGAHRVRDDKRFAVDHFYTKLLKLATGFQTTAGSRMATERDARLRTFLNDFLEEI